MTERNSGLTRHRLFGLLDDVLSDSPRDRLIRAVVRSLLESADTSISMRHIAGAANVSTGSVYLVVESKNELLDLTKQALVEALGSGLEHDRSGSEFTRRLSMLYHDSGAMPKFLADRRRPLVALPGSVLNALGHQGQSEVSSHWSPDEFTQILLTSLTNIRSAHPSAVELLIQHGMADLCRGIAIASLRPPMEAPTSVIRLLEQQPFEIHFTSRWTASLAGALTERRLNDVSLTDLAKSVGVATSTAYETTTVQRIAVALHLDIFHALVRNLDLLDDPADRLMGLHHRVKKAAASDPWLVRILLDAQLTPEEDWRRPQPRPFESWIELQVRALDRMGRIRSPYDQLLHGYSALAIAPLGVLITQRRFNAAFMWPSQLASASLRFA